MYTHFRDRYPKGSLITELLAIEHGKYIVRALVEVEGVTLATGIAGADTVETAEDNARNRALAVLGIFPSTVTGEKETFLPVGEPVLPIPQTNFSQEKLDLPSQSTIPSEDLKLNVAPFPYSASKFNDTPSVATPDSWEPSSVPFADEEFSPLEEEISPAEDGFELESPTFMSPKTPEPQPHPQESSVPSYLPNLSGAKVSETAPVGEPIDFSDIVARTNVELRRIGWSADQGRDYLIQTYNKRSRSLLTDQELLDFLRYLETQPTPND